MKNAKKLLTPAQLQSLEDRIAQLEKKTDAEVLCVVATESGRYDRAESFVGLAVALGILLTVENILSMGDWEQSSRLLLWMQVIIIVLGFAGGSIFASYWHGLRRLFVSRREIENEVQRSAHQVFSVQRLSEAQPKGCMLLYISLFERRLEIRCDQKLSSTIPASSLDEIHRAVLPHLKNGRLSAGLEAGLNCVQDLLANAVPSSGSPDNRVPNKIMLFHPRPF